MSLSYLLGSAVAVITDKMFINWFLIAFDWLSYLFMLILHCDDDASIKLNMCVCKYISLVADVFLLCAPLAIFLFFNLLSMLLIKHIVKICRPTSAFA